MSSARVTWILTDQRTAVPERMRAVAQQLCDAWHELTLRYNGFSGLAGLTGGALWHLDAASKSCLASILAPAGPDWVLSGSRQAAVAALAVQKASPATRLVHFGSLPPRPARFALIVAEQEQVPRYARGNLLRLFHAPRTLTQKTLHLEAARWQSHTARLPRPFILLALGAATKGQPYEPADFKTLAAHASAEAERLSGALLIVSAPQTGPALEAQVKSLLTVPYLFHSGQSRADNPYPAFLGLADAILAMADSETLLADALFTRKPLYIFLPPHGPREAASLPQRLFEAGAAKSHTYPLRLDWQPTVIPEATEQILRALRARG